MHALRTSTSATTRQARGTAQSARAAPRQDGVAPSLPATATALMAAAALLASSPAPALADAYADVSLGIDPHLDGSRMSSLDLAEVDGNE